MAARVFAIPDGPAIELALVPRLESWERHEHRSRVALREFVAHVRDLIDPVIDATPGELPFRLDVGLGDEIDPLWQRDLDNYLFPIARGLPDRVVSVWGTKGPAADSRARVGPAVEITPPADWEEFVVAQRPAGERSWKEGVREAIGSAMELREGPVALQLAFTVGPGCAWTGMWKPSIDGLEPLLGRTYPDRDWNPQDGRILRLGLHRAVDPSFGHQAAISVWARSADEAWPEIRWLAALDQTKRNEMLF